MEPGAVRLDRLNAGAPFVDTHQTHCLDMVIGSVVSGSAEIEDGKGIARILLSKAKGVADTVQKILEGVIRNISVGYWLHKVVKTEADDGSVARHDVVDWEPLEISAVPVPADAGSQIRSAEGNEGEALARSSCLIVTRSSASGPSPKARGDKSMAAKPTKPKSQRNKTPAQIEAEKKRLAEARRAAAERAKRDEEDEEKDEDERDDEERDGDEGKKDDDAENDDERDGDDEDDDKDERDGDDEDEPKKDDERSAGAAARRAADAAVKAERVRSARITEMAERAGLTKLGRKHLDQGTSVKRFGEIVLERMLKKQEARGNDTLAGNGTEEVGRDVARSGSKAAFQREVEEGASFFRRLSGKPAPKNA